MTKAGQTMATIVAGIVSLGLIAGVVVLQLHDKSTQDILSLIGVGVVPILSLVLNGKLSSIAQTAQEVHRNTNGTNAALLGMIQELQQEVARRPLPAGAPNGTESGSTLDGIPPSIPA